MLFAKEKIVSFTKLTLTVSGMRSIDEYEIVCSAENAEIAHYTRFYTRDEDDRELNKSAVVPTDRIINLMNDCGLMSWDGFSGTNPRNVRDGYMFRLTAEVNEGKRIRAEGSNNYPRHYREFKSAITNYLYEEKERQA